jgi:DNA-binding MarR family transcriptional regulator
MNDKVIKASDGHGPLLEYQIQRLQVLIGEMMHCCQDRMISQARKFDLPPAELKCLMLFGDERYLTVKGIALKLEVAKSRVTKILEGMEKRGLITRTDDPQDARIRLIALTPEGRRKFDGVAEFIREMHRSILLNIEEEERKGVFTCLETLRAAMETAKQGLLQA